MSGRRLIIEADGGSRGNPGPAAFGAVVRDAATGEVLVERFEAIGVATNNVAEYRGLLAGLQAAAEVDPTAEVEARLDSKLVVEQMSGRWKIKDPTLRGLALDARDAARRLNVTYTWVPREQNKAADALVNQALDGKVGSSREAAATRSGAAPQSASPSPRALPGWAPDLGPPTTTLLVRHGATEHTLARAFSGRGGADPELAPVGHAQAEAVAREVKARGDVHRVVTSPMRRARQTAQEIASACGIGDIEVIDDLAECDFGDWDGLTFAQVREAWPDQLTAWLSNTAIAPPGGESFDDHRRRVDAARRQLLGEHRGERIVTVAHVTPIKTMVCLALDVPIHPMYRMELLPCSLTTVNWWADGNASMLGFAESAHLRGIVAPG